ncbi:hypothetical protein FI667_g3570, partial [Globisporangium splendens]
MRVAFSALSPLVSCVADSLFAHRGALSNSTSREIIRLSSAAAARQRGIRREVKALDEDASTHTQSVGIQSTCGISFTHTQRAATMDSGANTQAAGGRDPEKSDNQVDDDESLNQEDLVKRGAVGRRFAVPTLPAEVVALPSQKHEDGKGETAQEEDKE